jgi:hypothetical protein
MLLGGVPFTDPVLMWWNWAAPRFSDSYYSFCQAACR